MGNKCCNNPSQKEQENVIECHVKILDTKQLPIEKGKDSSTDVLDSQATNDSLQFKRNSRSEKLIEISKQLKESKDQNQLGKSSKSMFIKESNLSIIETRDANSSPDRWIKISSEHYIFGSDFELKGKFVQQAEGFEGEGTFTSPEITFRGTFKKSQPFAGLFLFAEGTKLELKSPIYGKINWKNNRKYKGDLLGQKPHGKGRMRMQNQDEYEGEFMNGLIHGSGTYKWKSGSTFIGNYVNGVKQGKGVYRDLEGGEIEGTWQLGSLIEVRSKIDSQGKSTPKSKISVLPYTPRKALTPRHLTFSLSNVQQENEQSPIKRSPKKNKEFPQ